jgi:uncharacterized protein (TIRG00374 family)
LFLLGTIILILAILKFDIINNFIKIKDSINYLYIIFSIVAINSVIVLRAYRWKFLLRELDICKLTYFDALKISGSSFFLSSITPNRLGEVSKVFMVKENRIQGFAAFSIEYLTDTFAAFFVPLVLAIIVVYNVKLIILSSLIIVLVCLIAYLFLNIKLIEKIMLKLLPKSKILIENKKKVIQYFNEYLKNKKIVFISIFIAILNFLIALLIGYIIFLSIGININFIVIVSGLAIAHLIGILSFIPLGVGIREVSAIGFFGLYSIDYGLALNGMIIYRIVTFSVIFFGYLLYLINLKKM